MDALIKIDLRPIGDDESPTVMARDLYAFLGLAEKQFVRWAEKNIVKNDFAVQGIDFEASNMMLPDGRDVTDYILTIDFAKKLSMLARTAKGESARQYFLACERAAKAAQKPRELTREEILVMALESERERKKLEAENAVLRPKADLADSIAQGDAELTRVEAGKILGIPVKLITNFMIHHRWTNKAGKLPMTWAEKAGLVGCRVGFVEAFRKHMPTVVIRGKGLAVLHETIRTGDLVACYEDPARLIPAPQSSH